MKYQGPESQQSKLEYAQSLTAALAWLILRQQDAVGLTTFDQEIRAILPPSGNPLQLQQVLEVLSTAETSSKTSMGPIFHDLATRLTRRGIVLVVSDFFDDVQSLMAGLRHLRYRRHDVILLQVLDPAEIDFPFRRPTMFRGLEQMPQLLADPLSIRKAYQREIQAFLETLRGEALANRMEYCLARTDQPVDTVLRNFLHTRNATIH